MKFRAHETFSIRKGWLHKGMRHVIDNPLVFIDKEINPMDKLGLGSNMVKSLRYWLQATGLTVENQRTRFQRLTSFGQLVWDNDRYIEEDGTLYLIHYFLATNKDLATSWYYFFNEYQAVEITKDNYIENIKQYLLTENEAVAERSLYDDFDCIVKTYLPNSVMTSPENNMDSPFSELQLIDSIGSKEKVYLKKTPHYSVISPFIILAVMLNERDKNENKDSIKIAKLENESCNIGKVFNLDAMAISAYLDKLQNMGFIKVIRTAGLDEVKYTTNLSFYDIVKQYYESINM